MGNFGLALCDHAMNGFFHATEWLPVFASALAVGFLGVALVDQHEGLVRVLVAVLALQVVVGIVGFYVHLVADINGLSSSLFENFIHGAPVFAPLLFVDLMCLAMLGLWGMRSQGAAERSGDRALDNVGNNGIESQLPSAEPDAPIEDRSR